MEDEIVIRTLLGTRYKVKLNLQERYVRELKLALQRATGVGYFGQKLVYGNSELIQDDLTLSECGLQPGAVVTLVLDLSAGY